MWARDSLTQQPDCEMVDPVTKQELAQSSPNRHKVDIIIFIVLVVRRKSIPEVLEEQPIESRQRDR